MRLSFYSIPMYFNNLSPDPGYLKVHKNENFLASILNFVLFQCYLCINNKILVKIFLDWTILGGATIISRSLKTTRNEKNFQDRPKFFFF
jgi:hypothetical protein